jgi:hypothetical protein
MFPIMIRILLPRFSTFGPRQGNLILDRREQGRSSANRRAEMAKLSNSADDAFLRR